MDLFKYEQADFAADATAHRFAPAPAPAPRGMRAFRENPGV
jgi:hypothetical protein